MVMILFVLLSVNHFGWFSNILEVIWFVLQTMLHCSVCQSQLPATGVPVTRQRADQMKEMFHEYVKQRTLQNWKFYIVSFTNKILNQLLNTVKVVSL